MFAVTVLPGLSYISSSQTQSCSQFGVQSCSTLITCSALPSLLLALQVYDPRSSGLSLLILRVEDLKPSVPGPVKEDVQRVVKQISQS